MVLRNWYYRQFTLMGKVLIVNALIASIFVYKMMVLPPLTDGQIKRIDRLIGHFIWNGKRSKIPLEILRLPKNKCGLKLVDFKAKYASLKISWIPRISGRFDSAYFWLFPKIGDLIWSVNLSPVHVRTMIKTETLWKNILMEWCNFHYCTMFVGEEVKKEILWLNSCILVDGMPIINYTCIKNGLLIFEDLLNEDGNLLEYADIIGQYGHSLTWFEYVQLINAVPKTWWYLAKNETFSVPEDRLYYENIKATKKVSSVAYNSIINRSVNMKMTKYHAKFIMYVVSEYDITDYLRLFKLLYKLTNDTKLRNFQYRMLLFKIFTNDTLHEWKVKKL